MDFNASRTPSRLEFVLGWAILLVAIAWALVNLHKGRGAAWDEWEFLRATDWVRQGQVPYRDFWEHHSPLQWYLMAPAAALAQRAGNTPLLWLRWAQTPLWVAGLAALWRCLDQDSHRRRLLLAALMSTPFFVFFALEYRVDSLSTILALLAVTCHARAFTARTWAMTAGALWTLVALANLRLGPMALCGLLLLALLDPVERRWRINPQFLALAAGGLLPLLVWAGYLLGTHSLGQAMHRMLVENAAATALVPRHNTGFFLALGILLQHFDLPALVLMLGGMAGLILALLGARRPGPIQALALLQVANLVFIFQMRVYYPYHFQFVILLMVPLLGYALTWAVERWAAIQYWPRVLLAVLALQLAWNGWCLAESPLGEDWAYQDAVLRGAETAAQPSQKILDGCGGALTREPAYSYWFIPLLVRLLSLKGRLAPYSMEQFNQDPPAAIIYNLRLENWFQEWPTQGIHASTHYLPDYPELWLPGMSWLFTPRHSSAQWVVPATADYRILVSPRLADHPWFKAPLAVNSPGPFVNPEVTIDPKTFTCIGAERLNWKLNEHETKPVGGHLQLHAGDRLEAAAQGEGPLGLMVVPAARTVLFRSRPGTATFDVLTYYKNE